MEEMVQMVPTREMNSKASRVEELMDRILDAKLVEFEARLNKLESEESAARMETVKMFKEFGEKLDRIADELNGVEKALDSEKAVVSKIRKHEQDAVTNVRSWEKKSIANIKRQLKSKKFLKKVRGEIANRKLKESIVKAIFKDRHLTKMLTDKLTRQTSTKIKKQKITSKMAKSAEKKVMKTVKSNVRKAARKAASKAAKTAVKKVAG